MKRFIRRALRRGHDAPSVPPPSPPSPPTPPPPPPQSPAATPVRPHRLHIRLPSLGRCAARPAARRSRPNRPPPPPPHAPSPSHPAPVLYDMYHQRYGDPDSPSTQPLEDSDAYGIPIVRHEQSRSDSAYLPEIDATRSRAKRSFFPKRETSTFHVPSSFSSRSRSSNAHHMSDPPAPLVGPRSTVDVHHTRPLRDEYDELSYDMPYDNQPSFMLDEVVDDSDSQDDTTVIDIRSTNHYAQEMAHMIKHKKKPSTTNIKARKIEPSPYVPGNPARLQQTASESKLYHAYTDALQREARSTAGGLRVIVDLLRESDGNPIVIEKAAMAIGILSENDSATRDVFGQHSAVQSLIQCLSIKPTLSKFYDRARIVNAVVYAVSCLVKHSPRNIRLFEMFDGPQKMGKAAASSRYENCPTIAKHALQALSELKHHPAHASESFIASSMSSSSSRTIKLVLKSMSVHEHRMDIQEYGLDALRTLLSRAGRHHLRMELLHLCAQATATAFKLHHESKEVQWQCLTLLCDLDDLKDDLFSLELEVDCFFGSLHLIINEANESSQSDPALEKVLLDLISRAMDVAVRNGWKNHNFADAAVDAGAVETVTEALTVYGNDIQLADKISAVLRQLVQSTEGKYRMQSAESTCAILSGIEAVNMQASHLLPS